MRSSPAQALTSAEPTTLVRFHPMGVSKDASARRINALDYSYDDRLQRMQRAGRFINETLRDDE